MNVVMLSLAIASGTSGTLCIRASKGFRRWGWGLAAIGAYAVATILLAWLVQRLPVGVVYAVWTGAAAVILVAIDRFAYSLRLSRLQLAGMGLTVIGVALLGTAVH